MYNGVGTENTYQNYPKIPLLTGFLPTVFCQNACTKGAYFEKRLPGESCIKAIFFRVQSLRDAKVVVSKQRFYVAVHCTVIVKSYLNKKRY